MACFHDEPCGCYGMGYADGKSKAFAEIIEVASAGNHALDCGCQPCVTIRAVLDALPLSLNGPDDDGPDDDKPSGIGGLHI